MNSVRVGIERSLYGHDIYVYDVYDLSRETLRIWQDDIKTIDDGCGMSKRIYDLSYLNHISIHSIRALRRVLPIDNSCPVAVAVVMPNPTVWGLLDRAMSSLPKQQEVRAVTSRLEAVLWLRHLR